MTELDRTSDVMYVAEMIPPTEDGAQVYDKGEKKADIKLSSIKVGSVKTATTPEETPKFVFKKLDPDENYSVKIRTLVNGRTIVSVSIELSIQT